MHQHHHKEKTMKVIHMSAIALALAATFAQAATPADLGGSLTPLGGEKAGGNGVPDWKEDNVVLPGWSYGKLRRDFFKYKDEKKTDTIDAANVDKYASKLTAGQVALIKQIKGYKMDVYPSHRYCSAPDFVVENTKNTIAKIGADGWSLAEAVVPGIPFPCPRPAKRSCTTARCAIAAWPSNGNHHHRRLAAQGQQRMDQGRFAADHVLPWAARAATTCRPCRRWSTTPISPTTRPRRWPARRCR
jgi:hypothetical protein